MWHRSGASAGAADDGDCEVGDNSRDDHDVVADEEKTTATMMMMMMVMTAMASGQCAVGTGQRCCRCLWQRRRR